MKTGNGWRIFLWAIVPAAILALLIAGVPYWVRQEVRVAPVTVGTAVDAVAGVVVVRAGQAIDLRVESGGRVIASELEPGETFEEGDVLLQLDETAVQLALERVRIDLEAEEALEEIGSLHRYDLLDAREELKRMEEAGSRFPARDLELQERVVARLEDEIGREKIVNRRRILLLRNEWERLEEELKKRVVRAPADGRVVEVFAYPGEELAPREAVARLLSRDRVVEASLSEEDFAGVEAGQAVTVRFLSYGNRLFPGRVSKVLPTADPATQRYTVHLDVEISEEMLVPGITGEASLVRGERNGALLMPRRALLGDEVYVVRGDRVEVRRVETGFVGLNRVEILSGLEAGDRVAVENLDRLRDGDRVRVTNDVP